MVSCTRHFQAQLELAGHLGPGARLSAVTTHAMHRALHGYTAEARDLLAQAAELQRELGGVAFQEALDVATIVNAWNTGEWDAALDRYRWLGLGPAATEASVDLAKPSPVPSMPSEATPAPPAWRRAGRRPHRPRGRRLGPGGRPPPRG